MHKAYAESLALTESKCAEAVWAALDEALACIRKALPDFIPALERLAEPETI